MQGVHKIIWLALRLTHTLSNYLIAAGLENLHVKIRSLIRDIEPKRRAIASYSFYRDIRTNISYYTFLFESSV